MRTYQITLSVQYMIHNNTNSLKNLFTLHTTSWENMFCKTFLYLLPSNMAITPKNSRYVRSTRDTFAQQFTTYNIVVSRSCFTMLKKTLFLFTQHGRSHIWNFADSPNTVFHNWNQLKQIKKIYKYFSVNLTRSAYDSLPYGTCFLSTASFGKSRVNMSFKMLVVYSPSVWRGFEICQRTCNNKYQWNGRIHNPLLPVLFLQNTCWKNMFNCKNCNQSNLM